MYSCNNYIAYITTAAVCLNLELFSYGLAEVHLFSMKVFHFTFDAPQIKEISSTLKNDDVLPRSYITLFQLDGNECIVVLSYSTAQCKSSVGFGINIIYKEIPYRI